MRSRFSIVSAVIFLAFSFVAGCWVGIGIEKPREHRYVDGWYNAHPHYVYLSDAGNHHDPLHWETESYVRPKTRAIIEIATADPKPSEEKAICPSCKHFLRDNSHGFDQNDAHMEGKALGL